MPPFPSFKLPQANFAPDDGSNGGAPSPSPAPTAAGGDNGAGGAPAPTAPAPTTPNWGEFLGSLETLNANLGGKLDSLVETVKPMAERSVEGPPAAPVDLETLSRAQLVEHIVGTLSQTLQQQVSDLLTPVVDQVKDLRTTVTTTNVQRDIDRLRAEHKDFGEWKDEMVALSKTHASLGVPDLYELARAQNKGKARELDTKYAPPAAPPPPPRWGGLLPGGAAKPGDTKPLDAKQAGIEAYREVQARNPGVLAALENLS